MTDMATSTDTESDAHTGTYQIVVPWWYVPKQVVFFCTSTDILW